jgi:hypothetical protein
MAVLCDPEAASVADAISFLLAADRTPPIPDDTADAVWSEVTRTMVAGLREIAGLVVPA